MPVIGFLRSTRSEGSRSDGSLAGWLERRRLRRRPQRRDRIPLGGRQRERLPALAAELVRSPVAVIVSNGAAAPAAKAATTTIPIVFVTGSDPVRDGLVTSFNRPGGNLTGISFMSGESAGKRLELLRQLVPSAATIGVMIDPRTNQGVAERRDSRRRRKPSGSSWTSSKPTRIANSSRRLPPWSSAKPERC